MKRDGEQKKKKGFFGRPLLAIIVVAGAFMLGNAVGSGQIALDGAGGTDRQAVAGLPEDLDYSEVDDVYDALRNNYDGKLTADQLINGMKAGLAEATGDPYTEYFTAKKATEFQEQLNNSFSGIGAELGKDEDDNLIIVAPISGFPADKAGLKPQDIITSVDAESTRNMSIDDAVSKIRGEKGTDVKLQIIRNKAETLDFTITRDDIKIESVKSEVLDGNIGYISVSTFGYDTAQLMNEAANKLKGQNVDGLILDLRGNPGGVLDAAVEMSDLWLTDGKTILQEKRGSVVVETFTADGPDTLNGIPTVVLIDEGSASASEIVAGALKDNDAAYLIGQKSYGKGVVQQPICIDGGRSASGGCSGDMLKVTVASWYRPNGENINDKGIKPDKEVKITDADIEAERDAQREAALEYLRASAR